MLSTDFMYAARKRTVSSEWLVM
ncbi:hypothetical protein [Candidatus Methanoprimaticola sp. MG2]